MVHIVWCSEGPCEPSTEYQFTDLDPKPHEIENRGTDFTPFFIQGLWGHGNRLSEYINELLSHKNWTVCIFEETGDKSIHKGSEDKVPWAMMRYEASLRAHNTGCGVH